MYIELDTGIIATGALIFLARIFDVSMGTVRTISIIQGRTRTAFVLGFMEVSIWLAVISAVITKVSTTPALAVFYALGFSTGNVVGIKLEQWIGLGHSVLRIISPRHGVKMAERIRGAGCAVTTFQGEGMCGPVTELYVVCRRREVERMIDLARAVEPDLFYITESAGSVSKMYRRTSAGVGGWRGILRRA